MLRRVIVAGVATCVLGLTFCFSQSVNAQTARVCWINSATGTPVPNNDVFPGGTQHDVSDPNHARIPTVLDSEGRPHGGVDFVRVSDGTWINSATGTPVPNNDLFPGGTQHDVSDPNNANIPTVLDSEGKPHGGVNFVRVPCPPTDASTTSPIQSGIVPGGGLLPGKDAGGRDTPDRPSGDTKTTDTKPTDTKTPAAPVKDDKPQQADAPKTQQTEKAVTGKDEKPSKATATKDNPKATKHLTDTKTTTAHKSVKHAKDKPKEDKTQVHIEFFSTGGGHMGGGG